jgi:hypothetical protein
VSGPATLLAFVAYINGDGALAAVALDRTLQARPDDRLAVLLFHALIAGLPPSALAGWVHALAHRQSARRPLNLPAQHTTPQADRWHDHGTCG